MHVLHHTLSLGGYHIHLSQSTWIFLEPQAVAHIKQGPHFQVKLPRMGGGGGGGHTLIGALVSTVYL